MSTNIFENNANLTVDFSQYNQDLLARGRSRLLYQFRNSTILDELVQATSAEAQELYDSLYDSLSKRTLMTATGVQLDGIGVLVGQERVNIDGATKSWLTTDDAINCPDQVVVWCSPASLYEDTVANDIEYRKLIFAKIFKNHVQGASVPELRSYIKLLTNENVSFITVAPLDIYLVVRSTIPRNVLALLLTVTANDSKFGLRYLLPFAATTRILGVVFLPMNAYNNSGMGFAPDQEAGRPDFARAAIYLSL